MDNPLVSHRFISCENLAQTLRLYTSKNGEIGSDYKESEDREMNDAVSTTSTLDRAVMILVTGMMLAWTLGIGIVGFVVLLAIAWALVYQSHILAVVLSFLVIAPLLLTLLWGVLMAVGLIRERWIMKLTAPESSWREEYWEQRVRLSYIPNLL